MADQLLRWTAVLSRTYPPGLGMIDDDGIAGLGHAGRAVVFGPDHVSGIGGQIAGKQDRREVSAETLDRRIFHDGVAAGALRVDDKLGVFTETGAGVSAELIDADRQGLTGTARLRELRDIRRGCSRGGG